MTTASRIGDLATRIATECKSLRTMINGNAAGLSGLNTSAKTSLVAAVNELQAALASGSAGIDDSSTGTDKVWSASKVIAAIAQAKSDLTSGASTALDTLAELAAAIGNDASFASSMTTALGNRVRTDAAQGLSGAQQLQACQNIGIGDPDTNYVTTFNAGLV